MALFHPGAIDAAAVRRILIIKWSAMGDLVSATAFVEDVRRAFPAATIDLNTLPAYAGLFRDDPRWRRVIAVAVRDGWRGMWRWLREIGAGQYDLVVDMQSNDRSRLLLSLLAWSGRGARWRIGHRARFPYHFGPARDMVWDRPGIFTRSALQAAGIATLTPHGRLHVAEAQRRHVAALMEEAGLRPGSYVIFLPGSQKAGFLKRWGVQRYAELARLLLARGVESIVLVGGPDEVEDCREIARLGGAAVVNLNGRSGIADAVLLAEGARAIVGNDTGMAHVCACTDTPMLVICGPTDPRRVRPIGPQVLAVQVDIPCRNCYAKDCPQAEYQRCMQLLTPHWVAEAVLQWERGGRHWPALAVPVLGYAGDE